jgi:hypothetical protein
MLIQNPNPVENGVDLTQINIPDTYSDLYALVRPQLMRYYPDLISAEGSYDRINSSNYEVNRFITYFCELYLGISPNKDGVRPYRSIDVAARMYGDVVHEALNSDIDQVVRKFRESLEQAIDELSYMKFPTVRALFVRAVMADISTFEILESSTDSQGESNGRMEQ